MKSGATYTIEIHVAIHLVMTRLLPALILFNAAVFVDLVLKLELACPDPDDLAGIFLQE